MLCNIIRRAKALWVYHPADREEKWGAYSSRVWLKVIDVVESELSGLYGPARKSRGTFLLAP